MEPWSIVVPVVLVVLGVLARLPWRRARVIRVESRIGRAAVVFDRPTDKPPARAARTAPPRLPPKPKRKARR